MKIAIDVSPLEDKHTLGHRVRGTGFYIENLKRSISEYFPENEYIFFIRGEKLPKNIDLVHFPYFEPFFLSLPILKKYKTVVTVHDLTPFVFAKEFPVGLKGKIKWYMQNYALKSANSIITDSIASKNDIIKYANVSAKKINVVYLAASGAFKMMEKDSVFERIRQRYKLPDKFVLYVGDVTWNKNLPRLIKAVEKIEIPLVMVGKALVEKNFDKSNPWNKDLSEIQALSDKNKKIIRLGFVSQENLIFLYNMATLFVMPSLYEGFGLPILEAMSCGCPVVTTKEGSLSEVAGDSAYFVDAYSIDSIAKGIIEVFNSKSLQQELSKKGLVQAKKFTWRKTAEETMSVYRNVNSLK